MTTTPSTVHLDELLGAYALNAVSDEERTAIEEYLGRSPRAAAEVADHLVVAAAMGTSTSLAMPPGWERINAAIDLTERAQVSDGSKLSTRTPTPTPQSTPTPQTEATVIPFPRRQRAARWMSAAAAAAAFGVLGWQNVQQGDRLTGLRQELAAEQTQRRSAMDELQRLGTQDAMNVELMLSTPGTRVASLTQEGKAVGRVLIDTKGRGFLIVNTDQQLASGKAYQLWGVQNDNVISLGVMQPGLSAMPLSAAGDWSQFVLTVESLPGVVKSNGPAIGAGKFA
jgi:hypothetical protein